MNVTRISLIVVAARQPAVLVTDEQLTVAVEESAWLSLADVIICPDARPRDADGPRALLARYPGCMVVAASRPEGGCVIATRDRQMAEFAETRGQGRADPWLLGPVAHAWMVLGRPLRDLPDALLRLLVVARMKACRDADERHRHAARRAP
jgi:hypothetical protein